MISATFAIGAALAGAAGTLYAMAYPVIDPYMGIMVGWKAFIAAVIGGIGNIRGAMIGGLLIGLLEQFGALVNTELRDVLVFSLLILVLLVKPTGLLGSALKEKV